MGDYFKREIFWAKVGEGVSWFGAILILLLSAAAIPGSPHPKTSVAIFAILCIVMPALVVIMRRARQNLMRSQNTSTSA